MARQAKETGAASAEDAIKRLAATGRNDVCPCGSGKKYKKCHLRTDEDATVVRAPEPDAKEVANQGWRLFEQRRPGAAEKRFRAALDLDKDLADAQVGIAMARLSGGDNDAAKESFKQVIAGQMPVYEELKAAKSTDAFDQPKAQPFIRASHALGCLCYDEENYAESTELLARVYDIDGGAVGTEARLVAGKAFVKLDKPALAIKALEPAREFVTATARAHMGLVLAHFLNGAPDQADLALTAALEGNPHLARAVLGQLRAQVGHAAAATPGSRDEAATYAQGFGDVWTDAAKAYLEEALERRKQNQAASGEAPSRDENVSP